MSSTRSSTKSTPACYDLVVATFRHAIIGYLCVVVCVSACVHNLQAPANKVPLSPACPDTQTRKVIAGVSTCVSSARVRNRLDAGQRALNEFRLDDFAREHAAIDSEGVLDYESHVSLWEQRGIAAAYQEDVPRARAAYEMLLALEPKHLLSYTLSPKATFVFERVRKVERSDPQLDVRWPREARVDRPLPLTIDIVSDPQRFFESGTVFIRERKELAWKAADFTFHKDRPTLINLPPLGGNRATVLQMYVQAYDKSGNTTMRWADGKRPREIPLQYTAPARWYRQWWVWAIAGTVVATSTGVAVYAATTEPANRIGARVSVD